ncbi:hypothetical protein L249_0051 [Ophiocordyceps polyrhachis-furcata BCC 54312]|uniref:DUF6594 domain-containing protein n=1 Tax=Ophiocordyceps polyrhachis-furcata BCC 54312 TaxID=1330021 RepID=A0A367LFF3_9HYPO|nr:hypothetical protein L249_0051 [Ophiocordyceps polyrhachis-furcata BCC 54312]
MSPLAEAVLSGRYYENEHSRQSDMECNAESQSCHEPAPVDGTQNCARRESPDAAAGGINGSSEELPSASSDRVAPMVTVEEIPDEQMVQALVTDDKSAPDAPLPSVSCLPSTDPGEGSSSAHQENVAPATDTYTPPTLSASADLKTPTMPETVTPSSLKAAAVALQMPLPVGECSPATSQISTQPLYGYPSTYYAPRPRRRPSALDYLVESPMGTSSSAGATFSSYNISNTSVLNGNQGDATPGRADAMRSLGYCAGPNEVPFRPEYQRSEAICNVVGSPRAVPSHLPATLSQVASRISQPTYAAEKPPMSGYQLLAAKLVGGLGGRPVTPMYRRFEALSHRLLLYMQADLMELEKELQMLDSRDTIERGYGIVPASRRQERWSNNPLAQQRTEILGQIGYKLSQYNKVMTSVRKTQDVAVPTLHEMHEYKTYLAANRLLADEETSFLDVPDDLVCLEREEPMVADAAAAGEGVAAREEPEDVVTEPMAAVPATMLRGSESEASSRRTSKQQDKAAEGDSLKASLSQLALAVFAAVLVPVFTFAIIPGFAGRMTVVGLVGAGIGQALVQSGLVQQLDRGAMDWVLCAGAYGATMAAVAGVV